MARVVVAPASFKGFASAHEAALAIAEGVRDAGHEPVLCPLADGGEGTLEALLATRPRVIWTTTVNPYGRKRRARLLWWRRRRQAFVELAQAAGWATVPRRGRDIWEATTTGVGLLVRRALEEDPRTVTLGLGGSVTNDGGAGLLAALGARLLDAAGEVVPPTPLGFERLALIDLSPAAALLAGVHLEYLSDVDNPLLGPEGASLMFARQKGAKASDLPHLEAAMARYAAVLSAAAGRDLGAAPYAGAAGGTGAALLALGATPLPGAATVAKLVGLPRALDGAALLITGEGRLDVQTLHGKAPQLAALEAWRRRVPVAVLVGQDGPNHLAPYGARLFLAHPPGTSPSEVRRRLPAFLRQAAAEAVHTLLPGPK